MAGIALLKEIVGVSKARPSGGAVWSNGKCFKRESSSGEVAPAGVVLCDPVGVVDPELEYGRLPAHVEEFAESARQMLYFCYRKDFPPIAGGYTSDAGWGCMLRTGQMLMAEALRRHLRLPYDLAADSMLLRLFEDDPRAPFSIHQIAKHGQPFQKEPGQWFGPSTIANVLCMLTVMHPQLSEELEVEVCLDGELNVAHLLAKCAGPPARRSPPLPAALRTRGSQSAAGDDDTVDCGLEFEPASAPYPLPRSPAAARIARAAGGSGSVGGPGAGAAVAAGSASVLDGAPFRGALVFVVVRLGLEVFNPVYIPSLLSVFRFPQSLGILGGKPNSSYYFFACQDNHVFYLDPHYVRSAVRMSGEIEFDTESFHWDRPPLVMPIERMDPSMALAFYIRDRDDMEDFCQRVHRLNSGEHPVFRVVAAPRPPPREHSQHPDADEDDIISLSDSDGHSCGDSGADEMVQVVVRRSPARPGTVRVVDDGGRRG